ncbi:hypothetical protein CSB96_4782 [Pseudomonas aeruginosa]|nr:hypothetical protein CSB96_4782 [Pseudomonas aeruginosa]GAA17411.1 hypothetical protein NCGM1179_2242 [Pseudomonas aeruginosa NCMG1179]
MPRRYQPSAQRDAPGERMARSVGRLALRPGPKDARLPPSP